MATTRALVILLLFVSAAQAQAGELQRAVAIRPDIDGWFWTAIDANHLYVGGTLIYASLGDVIDDPINLHKIYCDKTTSSCEDHNARIFNNQELVMGESNWRVISWDAREISAQPLVEDVCRTTRLKIDLKKREVTFTVTPGINPGESLDLCEKTHFFPKKPFMTKLVAPAEAMQADPRTK